MRLKIKGKDGGFTLLEVILVLIFISIFATIAVSRQANPDVSLTAAAEVLKAHIRYAQMRAMNSTVPWGVHAEAGTSYWLFNGTDTGNRQFFPGESEHAVDLIDDNLNIAPETFTLRFDQWGAPSGITFVGEEAAINLSSGAETASITIIENTGFVR